MDQITEIQSNVHGKFNANRGDNSVFGSGNVIGETRTYHQITNISVINQGGPSRAKDGEPKETSRPYWVVPYSRNRTFTGRNVIIELVKGYCKSKDHNRVALLGLGGSGKTQIALEYVHQSAQERGCDVFWVNGSGVVKFSQGFRTIAQKVQIPGACAKTNEERFLSSMKAWFEGPDSGDWILVIDNADNEDDFLSNDSQISKFIPQGKGTVIFTTRSRQVASRQGCKGIEVGKMAGEEARELFSKCFHNWDSLGDEEGKFVPMILDSLDYLPLAVVGAAAFMTETLTRPSNYWSIFQENDQTRTTLLSNEFSDIRLETDMTKGILGTYFITFDRITKQMPTAAGLLRLIAFFDRQNIPEELLSQCGLERIDGSIEFRLAIGKLLGFSLITDVSRDGRRFYELHRLVQLSIRAYLSPEELDHWKVTALRVVSRLFPRDKAEWRYGGSAAAYVPHALAVTKDSTDSISETLGFSMGKYFLDTGSYGEAEIQARQCIARRDPDTKHNCDGEYWSRILLLVAVKRLQGRLMEAEEMLRRELSNIEEALGPDHSQTLACVNDLAKVLGNLGRYRESATMFRVALDGREKALGPGHPETLKSVRNLGGVLRGLGCYHESESMIRRALEGNEKVLGLDHPDTLQNVDNLASVLQALGRYSESETMVRRALEGKERDLGPDHPDTLTSANILASVLNDLGRYGESETMFRRALEGREKVLGPGHPDTLRSANSLALVLRGLGRYGESETMLRRAVEAFEKVLGPDHPDTLTSANNRASILQALGMYSESERMFRRALESYEKVLGPDHPDTLRSANSLALVLRDLGRYDESEAMLRRAVEGFEKVFGPDYPDTLTSVHNLASVLQDLRMYAESERMSRRALVGREKILGADHLYTIASVNNRASILQALGKYDESERMFRRALESKERVLGSDHPDTLTTVDNLASVLQDLRMYAESERLSRRALEGREKILGADHPYTLTSVNNRASILQALGMYDESERMFRRALESSEKVLGPDHPDTLTSVHNLASVLQDLCMYAESERLSRRALEGREKVLGADHPYTLTSVYDLAGVLEDQGKYDESEKMWRRALESRETALGPEHNEVYKTLERLAGLYEKQRKYSQAKEAHERAWMGFSKTLGEQHPTTLECIKKLTELRETKLAAERTSAIDAEVVVNDVNSRRSLHDCLRKLRWLRRRRGLRGGKPRKRL